LAVSFARSVASHAHACKHRLIPLRETALLCGGEPVGTEFVTKNIVPIRNDCIAARVRAITAGPRGIFRGGRKTGEPIPD
jgi:hypothetical protein